MCMHFMKIVGVYNLNHIYHVTVSVSYFIKNKNKEYVLPLGFELGIAWSTLFSETICTTDLPDV